MFNSLKKLFTSVKSEKNSSKTILVVDDDELTRKMLTSIISKDGFNVDQAENGEMGFLKAREIKPDLILLDCEMPVMGGVELCGKLKGDPSLKNIPVIFLTSVDTPSNILNCFELDAENYLSKPIGSKLLLSQIKMTLDEKQALQ